MTSNPVIIMSVPYRYTKGGFVNKNMHVEVVGMQYSKRLMTVEYTADMFGIGAHEKWRQLVSNDAFMEMYCE